MNHSWGEQQKAQHFCHAYHRGLLSDENPKQWKSIVPALHIVFLALSNVAVEVFGFIRLFLQKLQIKGGKQSRIRRHDK